MDESNSRESLNGNAEAIGVLGLGYVGLPVALALGRAYPRTS